MAVGPLVLTGSLEVLSFVLIDDLSAYPARTGTLEEWRGVGCSHQGQGRQYEQTHLPNQANRRVRPVVIQQATLATQEATFLEYLDAQVDDAAALEKAAEQYDQVLQRHGVF